MKTAIVVTDSIAIGRRRLGALIVGVAVASAAVTGVAVASVRDAVSDRGQPATTPGALADRWAAQRNEFLEGIEAASPGELAGAFGNEFRAPSLAERWQARRVDFVNGVAAASREVIIAARLAYLPPYLITPALQHLETAIAARLEYLPPYLITPALQRLEAGVRR